MISPRFSIWLGTVAFLAAMAVVPAYALTTMEAPVNTDVSQRFADPDGRRSNFSGDQGDQTPRGFSVQVRPADRPSNDPNSPNYRPLAPPGMFWAPGLQLPKH